MKTAIIYGSGISGATCARLLAECNYQVVVFEARNNIGGLCFDAYDDEHLYIQQYGPHIFHTNDEEVNSFVTLYGKWKEHKHSVLACLKDDVYVPVPFNFLSIKRTFEKDKADYFIAKLKEQFHEKEAIRLNAITSKELLELKQYIIKHIFEKYTAKQWGKPLFMVDKSIIDRIPIKLTYENYYFTDKYQYMPKDTFTVFIYNLLSHKNITVVRNSFCDYMFDDNAADIKILTGPLDAFFRYRYGRLKYRSIQFDHIKSANKQRAAVINYTESKKYTRITDFSLLKDDVTFMRNLCIEYPTKANSIYNAYYPVKTNSNVEQYKKFAKENGYLLCGRLACYEYLDIDDAILKGIQLVKGIKNK